MRLRQAPTPRQIAFRHRLYIRITAAVTTVAIGVISVRLLSSPLGATTLLAVDEVASIPSTEINPARNTRLTTENTDPMLHLKHEPTAQASSEGELRWFNGRPVKPVKTMSFLVTAYSPDARSCGDWADGITASGYTVWTNGFKSVAADPKVLKFGSLVSIPGYDNGAVVPVLDKGGKIKGNRLDVLYPTHEEALRWGAKRLNVVIWDYADGKPNDFKTAHRRR